MSQLFILYLLSLTLRSVVLAALVGVTLVLTRKVHIRHAAWCVVLCLLFLMPIADALLPAALVPPSVPEAVRPIKAFIVYSPASAQPPATSVAAAAHTQADGWLIAAILTTGITLSLLGRLLRVFRDLARIKRASRVVSHDLWDAARDISVRESASITIPLTVGVWKPSLILPLGWREWDEWKLRAVLTHERTHIERRDWGVAVIASVAKCIYWFNPLVWWLEKKLSTLAEQASDEACVRACGDPSRYAETLLQFASAASHRYRSIGGVAMAHYKISQRIERILALRRPGLGVLPRPAWALLLLASLPVLYVSAASQSGAKTSAIDAAELKQVFQTLLPPIAALPSETELQIPTPETRQSPPRSPAREETPVAPSPVTPPAPQHQVPPVNNPDLVGEIKLILAPVDVQLPGQSQVEIRTNAGTSRYTGTAVWNVANNAVPASFWSGNSTTAFALTDIEGRKALFEDREGNTFSYGCPNCTFFVSKSGVGPMPANPDAGVAFQLSADGRTLSATCHASECRGGSLIGNNSPLNRDGWTGGGGPFGPSLLTLTLRNAETMTVGVARSPNSTNGICFNLLGSRKVDGTLFTDADCERMPSILLFSFTR